jgi:protein TonB
MKLFLSILVSFIFINKTCSQLAFGKVTIEIEIDSDTIFTTADIMGPVPNGDTTWKDSIIQKLNTSEFRKNGAKIGKYTIIIQYLVDVDGSIGEVRCLTATGYGMCQEAVRAIRSRPRWEPAPQGQSVKPLRTSGTNRRQ